MRNFLILIVMLGAFMFASQANAQHPQNGWNNNQFNRPYYGRYYYRPPIVGYRPVITWLPSGTSLNVYNPQVYTYGGRRYVRFGINAGFYDVRRVDTFNYDRQGIYRKNGRVLVPVKD